MERLKQILINVGKLNEQELEVMVSCLEEYTCKKGTTLIKEGSRSKDILFIQEGYVRSYNIVDGLDRTIHFGQPGQFIASIQSISNGLPSTESYQAISDISIVRLKGSHLERLQDKVPALQSLINVMLQDILVCKEERINGFVNLSSMDRYKHFVENHSNLAQVVSINHLSSYLGMAPETLSRIRAKVVF